MNVTCPNCATVYRVDPVKVPDAGVRARCTVCSAVFAVRRESTPSPVPAATHAGTHRAVPSPVSSPPPATVQSSSAAPPAPPPASPAPATGARAANLPPPALSTGAPRPAVASRPAAPAGPAAPGVRPAAAPAAPPAPAPAPAARPAQASPAGRPVNPFLSQDPALKARRLARALISDMVVYHPVKRQEGLRDGTLKQLFEDEIKKSWEEYSDQVGREVAESTGYFKEALNEILAGGRQIF